MNQLNKNYFEWFELPMTFPINRDELRTKYQLLQKKYHPDRLNMQNDIDKMQVIQLSANLNEAYRILQNSVATADYCLSLTELQPDNSENATDSDILMQQFELREQLESLQTLNELISFEEKVSNLAKIAESNLWLALNQKNWQQVKQKRDNLHYFAKLQEEIERLLEKRFESTFESEN